MIKIFPRMTKCTFHLFGASGDVQKYDALCILPLNIINEKIYILIWFWFMTLSFISMLAIGYRLSTIVSSQVRLMILRTRARLVDRYQLGLIVERVKIGDWFVLYQLSKNIDPISYRDLLTEFVKTVKNLDNNGQHCSSTLLTNKKHQNTAIDEFEIRA